MEKANHTAAQRWWRTLADALSPAQVQASLDRFCVRVGDARPRRRADGQLRFLDDATNVLLIGPPGSLLREQRRWGDARVAGR